MKLFWIVWGTRDADRAGFPALADAVTAAKVRVRRYTAPVSLYDCSDRDRGLEILIGVYKRGLSGSYFVPDRQFALDAIQRIEAILIAANRAKEPKRSYFSADGDFLRQGMMLRDLLDSWRAELNAAGRPEDHEQ